MVEQLSNQKSWKPWQGLVYLAGAFVLLIASSFTLQSWFGMFGLVLSQILFLGYAIGVTKLHKTPLKEVFPVKMISIKEFFGTVIFAVGAILANIGLAGLGMVLFPQGMENVQATTDFLYGNGLPPMLIVFIVSLTPAICEEALMRGGFLSHFRGLKNEWAVMAIVGVGFGLLHTSTIKFLSTGFLGACLAYLIIRKKNIVFPALVHFLNNFLSSAVGVLTATQTSGEAQEAAAQTVAANPSQMIGAYLMMACAAPILLYLGAVIMGATKNKGKMWAISGILSGALLLGGFGCNYAYTTTHTVCQFSASTTANIEVNLYEFEIKEKANYQIVLSGSLDKGQLDVKIVDENGEIVTTDKVNSGMVIVNQVVTLEPGKYTIIVGNNDSAGEDLQEIAVQGQIVNMG